MGRSATSTRCAAPSTTHRADDSAGPCRVELTNRPVTVDNVTDQHRPLCPADIQAGLDLLEQLTELGAPVESLTVRHGELVVDALRGVTPPEGMRALRELAEEGASVTIDRHPTWAELARRFSGRRLRFRVRRGDGAA